MTNIYKVTMTLEVDAETADDAEQQARAELIYPNSDDIRIEVE